MPAKSMYDRGGSGMTRGGLDRYMGPQAIDFSNLPEPIEEHKTEPDKRAMDCEGKDRDESVCQIAKAEQQARKTDSAT